MKTLLEKAKGVPVFRRNRKEYSDEHIELIMAWAKDEIGFKQLAVALGKSTSSGNILYAAASIFKWGVQNGKIIRKI